MARKTYDAHKHCGGRVSGQDRHCDKCKKRYIVGDATEQVKK